MALIPQVLKLMVNFTQVSSSIGANGTARLHKVKHMLQSRRIVAQRLNLSTSHEAKGKTPIGFKESRIRHQGKDRKY